MGGCFFRRVPGGSEVAIAGKLSIRFHVTPRSSLFQRPAGARCRRRSRFRPSDRPSAARPSSVRLVAAVLEGQIGSLPGPPAIAGARIAPSVGRPVCRVRADGHVNALRIRRIDCDALDAHVAPMIGVDPIGHRHPSLRRRIPPIRPADVGADVDQVFLGRMGDDARDKSPADDGDTFPFVWLGAGRARALTIWRRG